MGGPVIINGVKYKELDNFYPCVFSYDEKTFSSSEQYFQYHKAFEIEREGQEYRDKIISTNDPMKCWELGQKVKLRHDWEDIKLSVMFDANLLKFTQNTYLQPILNSSLGSSIVCAGSTDFWNKYNSIILEQVRDIVNEMMILKAEFKYKVKVMGRNKNDKNT